MSRSGKSRPGLALTQFCCRNLKEKENRYKSRDFRWIMCLSSSSSRKQGWVCILESFFCDFPRAPVYRVLFRSKQSGHIIKCLLTEFVRARQENILHSVIFGTSLRSVCASWLRATLRSSHLVNNYIFFSFGTHGELYFWDWPSKKKIALSHTVHFLSSHPNRLEGKFVHCFDASHDVLPHILERVFNFYNGGCSLLSRERETCILWATPPLNLLPL